MKVGFRLSQCVKDIAHNKVNFNDVAFIISLTAVQPGRDLSEIIDNWINSTVLDEEHRNLYIKIIEQLFKENKVLQPRLEGLQRHWLPEGDIHNVAWMDLYPSQGSENPAVQTAWDNYRIVSNLAA